LFENNLGLLMFFCFVGILVVLELLVVVMSGVHWCGCHFLIERCAQMVLLQTWKVNIRLHFNFYHAGVHAVLNYCAK
jgi:hypothetical protein